MYTNVNIKEHETARKQQGRSGSATSNFGAGSLNEAVGGA